MTRDGRQQSTNDLKSPPLADAKTYLELAKISHESFLNRRSYEWKVAFGLWAAVGFITYFSVEHVESLGNSTVTLLGVLYVAIFLIWFFLWEVPLHRAFDHDRAFKHYYMHRAEGREAKWPADNLVSYRNVITRFGDFAWMYGQTTITAVFLLGSFLVIFATCGQPEKNKAHVELKASGATIRVQPEELQ